MFALLLVAFIVVPIVEIYVIVQVGHAIGFLNTFGLLLIFSIGGAWLARHEGFFVIQRVRERLDRGELPGKELLDGLLVLTGGILLLVPGFVTDAVGLVVLFPPTRALFRRLLQRRFTVYVGGPWPRGPQGPRGPSSTGNGDDVIDL